MLSRASKLACAVTAACCALFASVAGAAGPPPPKSTNGHAVTQVAAGLMTPTAFAWGAGALFAADGGNAQAAIPTGGGVFVLRNGAAKRLAGSPQSVFGIAWHNGTLYVSTVSQLLAWSGWNGTNFASRKAIYTAPNGFSGFNGLAFGANGRLYAGVDNGSFDHGPSAAPYQYDILSFNAAGKDLRIFARGLRQPWQFAFPAASSSPFVSVLGQDSGAANPPDYVVRVKAGQNYGFPKCNWVSVTACNGFAKPFRFFTAHTNPMGLAIVGSRLYISEFAGTPGTFPRVVSVPLSGGGAAKPLLTGFAAPIVGLGTHAGLIYVGELTGQVFRVKP